MTIQEIKSRNEERWTRYVNSARFVSVSRKIGPTGEPQCPHCDNSSQNGYPADSPGCRRCASCKKLFWEHSAIEDIRVLLAENERLERELHRLQLGDITTFEYERLVAWIKDPNRKQAMFAFTAGAVRSAASAIEESGILNP